MRLLAVWEREVGKAQEGRERCFAGGARTHSAAQYTHLVLANGQIAALIDADVQHALHVRAWGGGGGKASGFKKTKAG